MRREDWQESCRNGKKKCRCYLLTQMQCSGPHY